MRTGKHQFNMLDYVPIGATKIIAEVPGFTVEKALQVDATFGILVRSEVEIYRRQQEAIIQANRIIRAAGLVEIANQISNLLNDLNDITSNFDRAIDTVNKNQQILLGDISKGHDRTWRLLEKNGGMLGLSSVFQDFMKTGFTISTPEEGKNFLIENGGPNMSDWLVNWNDIKISQQVLMTTLVKFVTAIQQPLIDLGDEAIFDDYFALNASMMALHKSLDTAFELLVNASNGMHMYKRNRISVNKKDEEGEKWFNYIGEFMFATCSGSLSGLEEQGDQILERATDGQNKIKQELLDD